MATKTLRTHLRALRCFVVERERGKTLPAAGVSDLTAIHTNDASHDGLQGRGRAYWAALWVSLAAACLFCGYELVRSPANTLFKAAYGKAGLPYVMAATPPRG